MPALVDSHWHLFFTDHNPTFSGQFTHFEHCVKQPQVSLSFSRLSRSDMKGGKVEEVKVADGVIYKGLLVLALCCV